MREKKKSNGNRNFFERKLNTIPKPKRERKKKKQCKNKMEKVNVIMQMNMDFEEINLSRELLMNPSNHLRRL